MTVHSSKSVGGRRVGADERERFDIAKGTNAPLCAEILPSVYEEGRQSILDGRNNNFIYQIHSQYRWSRRDPVCACRKEKIFNDLFQ